MAMGHSTKTGFSFGVTSAIITTLGLMMGLYAGTHSRLAVIGGILTIAIADAFSDSLGIHIAEEAENKHKPREIWMATLSTFVTKFAFTMTFAVPVLVLAIDTAIITNIAWGLLLLSALSIMMAREQKAKVWSVLGEHLLIAAAVIVISNYVGGWISATFV